MEHKKYKNYLDYFLKITEKYPNRYFYDCFTGVKLKSNEFLQKVKIKAEVIFDKIGPGNYVGTVIGQDSLATVISYYAVVLSGNVFVPLSRLMTQYQFDTICKLTDIKNVIADGKISFEGNYQMMSFEGGKSEKDFKDLSGLNEEIEIFFTSGTTGEAKGIVHTQLSRISNAISVAKALKFDESTNILSFLPLTHTASWTYIVSPGFWAGSNIVFMPKFSRKMFWKTIEEQKINYVQIVPTILTMLLNYPEEKKGYDIRSLKLIGCGSAPLSGDLIKRFEDVFNVPVTNLYGLSETGPTHYLDPNDVGKYKGCLGKPLEINEVKVFEEGEIAVKGPNLMKGYFKKDDLNKDIFKDGWFLTGDTGFIDENNNLYLKDRKKDLIIRGGENIAPSEIDFLLMQHNAVYEAACFGIDDDIYGQEVVAAVVLKEGTRVSQEELINFCKEKMEGKNTPKKIFFLESIPKGLTGKILRREVKNIVKGKHNEANARIS